MDRYESRGYKRPGGERGNRKKITANTALKMQSWILYLRSMNRDANSLRFVSDQKNSHEITECFEARSVT